MDHGGIQGSSAAPAAMWNNLGCFMLSNSASTFQNSVGSHDGRWNATDKYWRQAASAGGWRVGLPGGKFTGDTFWIGFSYYRISGGATVGDMFGIHRGTSTWNGVGDTASTVYGVFRLNWVSGNSFQVVDSAGTSIGSAFDVSEDEWHWIAVEVDAVGAGTISVSLDGNPKLTAVSGDFAGSSATGDLYHLCVDYGKGATSYDDIIMGDGAGSVNNGLPNEVRIETLIPTSDDSLTGFTSTTYDKVDDFDLSDDDTTYSTAGTAADQYTLAHGSVGFTPDDIMACQLITKARKDDAGEIVLRPRIDSGGTYYNADDFYLAIDYTTQAFIWETDPDTAVAWTEAAANAVKPSGIIL